MNWEEFGHIDVEELVVEGEEEPHDEDNDHDDDYLPGETVFCADFFSLEEDEGKAG